MLTPSQKGSIAESAIVAAAIKHGIAIFKPINEGLRYDLVFELNGKFIRVQCKWVVRRGDAIVVPCVSRRRSGHGFVTRRYSRTEIDAFAGYCAEIDQCYFVPLASFPNHRAIQLRLEATRNNQRVGVNWAKDYELAARLGALGAVAQLGERDAGSVEAAGSSPAGSTKSRSRERLCC